MPEGVAGAPVKEGDEPIKVTHRQAWEGQASLQKLLGLESSFKARDSERLGVWGGILIDRIKQVNKIRVKLLREHGDPEKEDGLNLLEGTDAREAFDKDFDEELDEEMEINLQPIQVNDNMRLAPIIFTHLGFMLEVK